MIIALLNIDPFFFGRLIVDSALYMNALVTYIDMMIAAILIATLVLQVYLIQYIKAKRKRAMPVANMVPVTIVPTAEPNAIEAEILNQIRVALFKMDRSGALVYVSPYWETLTGYSTIETFTDNSRGCVHQDDRAKLAAKWVEFAGDVEQKSMSIEYRIVHKTTWNVCWVRTTIQKVSVPSHHHYIGFTIDITKDVEDVRYRNHVVDAFFDNISDALFLLDHNGNIEYANQASEDIFGWKLSEIKGKSVHYALHEPSSHHVSGSDVTCPIVLSVTNNVRLKDHIDRYYTKTGDPVDVCVTTSPCAYTDDDKLTSVLIVRDETRRKLEYREAHRNSEVVQQVNDTLQRTNDDLNAFAYAASHDLQEPLRTVGSFVSLLVNRFASEEDDDAKQYMQLITSGVSRMSMMIQDLLQYSRIETRGKPFEDVRLSSIFRLACEFLDKEIRETRAVITLASDCQNLPIVKGDDDQLRRVFENLFLNAMRFKRPDVDPVITVFSKDYDKWYWLIMIKDNGKGFDPKFSEQIFKLFKRLEYENTPGTGIGLTVCRKIVTRHGGKIWVESAINEGTTFYFTLPKIDIWSEMKDRTGSTEKTAN